MGAKIIWIMQRIKTQEHRSNKEIPWGNLITISLINGKGQVFSQHLKVEIREPIETDKFQ